MPKEEEKKGNSTGGNKVTLRAKLTPVTFSIREVSFRRRLQSALATLVSANNALRRQHLPVSQVAASGVTFFPSISNQRSSDVTAAQGRRSLQFNYRYAPAVETPVCLRSERKNEQGK